VSLDGKVTTQKQGPQFEALLAAIKLAEWRWIRAPGSNRSGCTRVILAELIEITRAPEFKKRIRELEIEPTPDSALKNPRLFGLVIASARKDKNRAAKERRRRRPIRNW
jgi:hypothetical protein